MQTTNKNKLLNRNYKEASERDVPPPVLCAVGHCPILGNNTLQPALPHSVGLGSSVTGGGGPMSGILAASQQQKVKLSQKQSKLFGIIAPGSPKAFVYDFGFLCGIPHFRKYSPKNPTKKKVLAMLECSRFIHWY